MNEIKRSGLAVLQLLILLVTLSATVIMFIHPACVESMLAEVARGVSAGLLLAGLKALAKISRPAMALKPISCWARYWWVVTKHELKCGIAAGYLFGLIAAMWNC